VKGTQLTPPGSSESRIWLKDVLKGHPPEGITVDYVVDDDEGMVEEHGGCVVKPYEGDPWDSELLGVLEAVEASELD
jgi:hypothetical protein